MSRGDFYLRRRGVLVGADTLPSAPPSSSMMPFLGLAAVGALVVHVIRDEARASRS